MRVEHVAVLLLTFSPPVFAQCQNPHNQLPGTQAASAIKIEPGGNNLSTSASQALGGAMASWNAACGNNLPKMSVGAQSPFVFTVEFNRGTYPGNGADESNRCGDVTSNAQGYELGDATIRLYENSVNGADCTIDLIEAIMHELGHALGLDGSPCSSNIMFEVAAEGARAGLRPTAADCNAVDAFWRRTGEPIPGSPNGDESNEDNQCVDDCDPGTGQTGDPGSETPIIISLLDERYELTPYLNGVVFDIDADGSPNQVAWTVGGSDDAFLVLDRNANGIIDDGSELFGSVTDQPRSAEPPNGFVALAVFDSLESEGNRDGYITSSDAVFDLLRLWVDANHNGVSDAGELLTLSDAGILFVDLAYGESRKVDDYGNEFRYWSLVGRQHDIITMWDVILRHVGL